jgi:cytochrome c-type biogenesis protein CcmE
MKAKHQRLTLALAGCIAIGGSALLAMSALEDKASYFYTPTDLAQAKVQPGQAIRLGGMVADKSIARANNGTTVRFVVEDGAQRLPVVFTGITPDLFKENSGVVAEGSLNASGEFVATNLLAKHDERYMPPQMEGKMHKTGKVEQ